MRRPPPPLARPSAVLLAALFTQGCTVCLHGRNWPFKIGTDPDAHLVVMEPVPATIAELIAIPHAPRPPAMHRIVPAELRTYTLRDVTLRSFQRSPDGDVHMVLADAEGRTMIAEATPPGCTSESSPWRAQIAEVRATVEEVVGQSLIGWGHRTVSMTGVGYMDSLHGQPGVAPNGMEIHPILAMCFGRGCALPEAVRPTGTLSATAAPGARCAD
jgi:hypothetical protein